MQLFAKAADWSVEALHLERDNALKTFKIQRSKPFKAGLIVKLDGISDRNQAEAWEKAQVYIPESALEAKPGETIFLKQIQGFDVADSEDRFLGRIIGFGSNGPQDLLEVERLNGKTALIPFVDDYIVRIDFDKKRLTLDVPKGLLDVEDE